MDSGYYRMGVMMLERSCTAPHSSHVRCPLKNHPPPKASGQTALSLPTIPYCKHVGKFPSVTAVLCPAANQGRAPEW